MGHFIWDVKEFIWNLRLNEVKEFREKNGHCIVPHDCQSFPKLGDWVGHARVKNNSGLLTKKQVEDLNELNFVWDVGEAKWLDKFHELITIIIKMATPM